MREVQPPKVGHEVVLQLIPSATRRVMELDHNISVYTEQKIDTHLGKPRKRNFR